MPSVELLKTISLTGMSRPAAVSSSPISIDEAAVAAQRDHLAVGGADLRADGLRQRVGHRAVAERRQDAAARLHLQVARTPHVAHAGVDGEDGVVLGQVAQRGRHHLGPQPLRRCPRG